MSGRRSMVSVRRCEPSRRAKAAGMASAKNQPDVPAVARSRSFQGSRQVQTAARLQDGCGVFPPMGLVEIGRQEEAGFVLEHGIDAHDEIAAVVVVARQVPANHLVGDRQEAAVRDIRHI